MTTAKLSNTDVVRHITDFWFC